MIPMLIKKKPKKPTNQNQSEKSAQT